MGNIQFNTYPIGSWNDKPKYQLPIEVVDTLANELAVQYQNEPYRKWYCGVIYEFGIDKVEEWRRRASEGNDPAKLFSKYVKDWRSYKHIRFASNPDREVMYDK